MASFPPDRLGHPDGELSDDEMSCDGNTSGRCMSYLLGELTAPEAAALEQQLACSPELNGELLVQSQILCALADSQGSVLVAAGPQASNSVWRNVTIIATIAACLLIAFASSDTWQGDVQSVADARVAGDLDGEETLLIARAWADSHVSFSADDDVLSLPPVDSEWDFDESPNDDSVMSWMVAAVAAGSEAEASQAGAMSDG